MAAQKYTWQRKKWDLQLCRLPMLPSGDSAFPSDDVYFFIILANRAPWPGSQSEHAEP